jgi:hypothetical protein
MSGTRKLLNNNSANAESLFYRKEGTKIFRSEISGKSGHLNYVENRLSEATIKLMLAYQLNNMNFVNVYLTEISLWLHLIEYYHSDTMNNLD